MAPKPSLVAPKTNATLLQSCCQALPCHSIRKVLVTGQDAETHGELGGPRRGRMKPPNPTPLWASPPRAPHHFEHILWLCKDTRVRVTFARRYLTMASEPAQPHADSPPPRQKGRTSAMTLNRSYLGTGALQPSGRCQPCLAQAASPRCRQHCTKALPAPSLNHSSAGLNHLVCAFDHPVQMISTPLNPPGLLAPLLPACSLLPALLGILQKQTLKGLKMPLAMMKAPVAARIPAPPPCPPAWGDVGRIISAMDTAGRTSHSARETGAGVCQRGQVCFPNGFGVQLSK